MRKIKKNINLPFWLFCMIFVICITIGGIIVNQYVFFGYGLAFILSFVKMIIELVEAPTGD